MGKVVERVKGVARKASADQITTLAAAIAYAFFLSLFPLLFALFALTGIVGGDRAFHAIMSALEEAVPAQGAELLGTYIAQITNRSRPGLLSLGIVTTLWTAAGGVRAIMGALNEIYDLRESRGFWKPRLLALGVLLACAILFLAAAIAILIGPELVRLAKLGVAAEVVRWPIGFVLVVLVFWLLYYLLPDRDQSRSKGSLLVGAVAGALLWLAVTFLFQLYVANFGKYDLTYGALGAVVVLLLWLYLTALAVLLGGVVAEEVERWGWGR